MRHLAVHISSLSGINNRFFVIMKQFVDMTQTHPVIIQ